jgi:hypothetical protein
MVMEPPEFPNYQLSLRRNSVLSNLEGTVKVPCHALRAETLLEDGWMASIVVPVPLDGGWPSVLICGREVHELINDAFERMTDDRRARAEEFDV